MAQNQPKDKNTAPKKAAKKKAPVQIPKIISGVSKGDTLRDGRAFSIKKGNAVTVLEAYAGVDGDSELLIPAMIAILLTIDKQPVELSELRALPIGDYLKIQNLYAEVNMSGEVSDDKLSDGRSFVVETGNADTVLQASRIVEAGQQHLMLAGMIRELLKVDGEMITLEDLLAFSIGDYLKVQNSFASKNF